MDPTNPNNQTNETQTSGPPVMTDGEILKAVASNLNGVNLKHTVSALNIVALIFVIMILVSWFSPIPLECGRGGPAICQSTLPALLAIPIIFMSIVVGICFLAKLVDLSRGKGKVVMVINVILGLGGGFLIFIFGVIAGLWGGIRANGSV